MSHAHTNEVLQTIMLAIFGGVLMVTIARKFNIPAIVLLLLAGVGLGPAGADLVRPESLGHGLKVLVLLAVGLILFEGGLTLDVGGYRTASRVIKRLLTVGVLVTWLSTALAIWLVASLAPQDAILAGSLVIVTGPTVITPMLRRIKVSAKVHNILHWEGVLIDPIGVFIAVLCLETVIGLGGGHAVGYFLLRLVAGLVIGTVGGFAIAGVTRRDFVPEDILNIFVLSCAVLVFGLTEILVASEAGLLSVTIAGLIVGVKKPPLLRQVKHFKEELTYLLIGMLFILLASRLTFEQFESFGARGAIVVAIVVFLVRPLNILVCSARSDLTGRERTFLSWIAPRGIVAASMASLIRIELTARDKAAAGEFIETFTYSVIIATIILQATSAGLVARMLRLHRRVPTGWLIVGSHDLSRAIARFLQEANKSVTIIDTNPRAVRETDAQGIRALRADARDTALQEQLEFAGVGNVLALTDNEDLNHLICHRWIEQVSAEHLFMYCKSMPSAPDHRVIGRRIWLNMPVPSQVSSEIHAGEASTVITAGGAPAPRGQSIPLVAVLNDGEVVLEPGKREDLDLSTASSVLWLTRQAEYLHRSLKDGLVIRSQAADRDTLIGELVDTVVAAYPKLPRTELHREIIEREKVFPTAVGHGIAIPHGYTGALSQRICAIAQIPGGVDFSAPDGEAVRLAFFVLSPSGDPEGHLATLAEIAHLANQAAVREAMLKAHDARAMMDIIRGNHNQALDWHR